MITEWMLSLPPEQAQRLALALALAAALMHAIFGAMQKGKYDPWVIRGALDVSYGVYALPVAIFLVPFPEPHMWPIFFGALVIHTTYKMAMAAAYSRAAYTVVYPITRGTGPLVTVAAATVIFSESYDPMQWAGVAVLTLAIFGLSAVNYSQERLDRRMLLAGIAMALATGFMVATYTTYDAWAIRATADPFTFLAWYFVFDGFAFAPISYAIWRRMENPPPLWPMLRLGIVGGILAIGSFGAIMLATRLDKVGEAAVMRETSVVFAGIIGWLFLGEKVGLARAGLLVLIALGAILVEFGG